MRDYKKEAQWEKGKYKNLHVKVDKQFAEEFFKKLDRPFSIWVKEEMKKYLENKK